MSLPRPRWPGLLTVLRGLALLGLWVGVDALLAPRGSTLHRIAAAVLGAAIALPGLLSLVGGRGRRLACGVAISATSILLAVLLVELGFRLSGFGAQGPQRMVPDPVLGLAGVPRTGDLDSEGYRNARALAAPDVVVLGDSNTFGFSVGRSEAIPQQLAEQSGWSVKGLAHGGYGPLQYLALTERCLAAEPRPKALVVVLYFGNDIVDAHRYLSLEHWARFRRAGVGIPTTTDFVDVPTPSPNVGMAMVDWVRQHSVFVGWASHVVMGRLRQNQVFAARADREHGAPAYQGEDVATMFTPRARAAAVDPGRPAVRDGLRVTGECLREIGDRCRKAGVPVLCCVLHTKEYVYAEWLQPTQHPCVCELSELVAMEKLASDTAEAAARDAGIEVLDVTKALGEALESGDAMYWATADGHLGPAGCKVVAAQIRRRLERWMD